MMFNLFKRKKKSVELSKEAALYEFLKKYGIWDGLINHRKWCIETGNYPKRMFKDIELLGGTLKITWHPPKKGRIK